MEEENKLDVVSIRLTKDRQLMSNEKMDRPLVADFKSVNSGQKRHT